MELIDVLNPDGTPAGEKVSKEEIHKKGLWHRSAHVWFVNSNDEILLQRRARGIVSHPDKYDISSAGHLSAGDTAVSGALREIREELGIDVTESELIKLGEVKQECTQNGGVYINKEYNDVFVVRKDISVEDFIIQPSEVDHVRYVSADELK